MTTSLKALNRALVDAESNLERAAQRRVNAVYAMIETLKTIAESTVEGVTVEATPSHHVTEHFTLLVRFNATVEGKIIFHLDSNGAVRAMSCAVRHSPTEFYRSALQYNSRADNIEDVEHFPELVIEFVRHVGVISLIEDDKPKGV